MAIKTAATVVSGFLAWSLVGDLRRFLLQRVADHTLMIVQRLTSAGMRSRFLLTTTEYP